MPSARIQYVPVDVDLECRRKVIFITTSEAMEFVAQFWYFKSR